MGSIFSHVLQRLYDKHDCRVLILGLDNAGKTTVLYRLKLGEVVTTSPTIGYNVETVQNKNVSCTVLDLGGQDRIRPLWRMCFQTTVAVIYVVDSSDSVRIEEACKELQILLSQTELEEVALLVMANKQDLSDVMSLEEIEERLHLRRLRRHQWHIQACAATTGDGLHEGLDWLSFALSQTKSQRNMQRTRDGHPCLYGEAPTPGQYSVVAKRLNVYQVPGDAAQPMPGSSLGGLPRGSCIDAVEIKEVELPTSFALHPDVQHVGRIMQPFAGWVRLHRAFVQKPQLVITLHIVFRLDGKFSLSCCNIAGDELVAFDAFEQDTVFDIQTRIKEHVQAGDKNLNVVLADGRLLSNAKTPGASLGSFLREGDLGNDSQSMRVVA